MENILMCKWKKKQWCCKCGSTTWWILWRVYIVVLNVVDTMKMIEETMGLKDIEEENKLESVYMLNAYYVDYTKHKFKVYMNEK